jgi:hypothetical protein
MAWIGAPWTGFPGVAPRQFLEVRRPVTPTLHFLIGQKFSHFGHMVCPGRTPTTSLSLHAHGQQVGLVALYAAQPTLPFRINGQPHAPIQPPSLLRDLFDPPGVALCLLAFSQWGVLEPFFNFSSLACSQRPIQLLADLGAVCPPASSGQVEVI